MSTPYTGGIGYLYFRGIPTQLPDLSMKVYERSEFFLIYIQTN
jgi:hypothetical protein